MDGRGADDVVVEAEYRLDATLDPVGEDRPVDTGDVALLGEVRREGRRSELLLQRRRRGYGGGSL